MAGQHTLAEPRLKVTHDDAYLHPITNVPIKYQLPVLLSLRDIAQTKF